MNEALVIELCRWLDARLRREGFQADAREEIASQALVYYAQQSPELWFSVLCYSSYGLLALKFAHYPLKKAASNYTQNQNRAPKTLDFTPDVENALFKTEEKETPAAVAEIRDSILASRRYAEELGDYRNCSRYRILLAQYGKAEDLNELARTLGVQTDTLRCVNRETLRHCRRRFRIDVE